MSEEVKNAPFWWNGGEAPKPTDPEELPEEVDVVIVGAGLTGLSAARTLAQRGRTVLVLDQGHPGIGASSRNGGMIGGGHKVDAAAMIDRHGRDGAAERIRELHIESVNFAKSLMAEESIDCDFSECGRFVALWLDSEREQFCRNLEMIQELAPVPAEIVPKNLVPSEVGTNRYFGGAVFHLHGGLNPAKWVNGLLAAATRQGARVQGNTPVLGLRRRANAFAVATPRASIRASEVLLATNGYTAGRFGNAGRSVFPVPSFLIASERLDPSQVREIFPTSRMIVETRVRHCYYRPSPDGTRILFGGRAALFQAGQSLFRQQLRSLMVGLFPNLRGIRITHAWKGNTGFTFAMEPHVGKMDGIWHALGYCGGGNSMAPWLGHKAALQILGDAEGETAFSRGRLERRWWYRGSPWFLPIADIGFRMKDAAASVRNRRQDRR